MRSRSRRKGHNAACNVSSNRLDVWWCPLVALDRCLSVGAAVLLFPLLFDIVCSFDFLLFPCLSIPFLFSPLLSFQVHHSGRAS